MKKNIKKLFIIIMLTIIAFYTVAFISTNKSLSLVNLNVDHEQSVSDGGKLAIVIDDFGQNRKGVKEMMSIRKHMTFAIMPFMQYSKEDSINAYKKGYEVIVHLPLEATCKHMDWVGPRPILTSMSNDEIKKIVYDSFDSVYYASGANIHMGSKAGNDERVISCILDIIKQKKIYFVDSRSENHPIAKKIANEKKVICFDRDVFIDGNKPKSYIINQLRKSGDIALKKGKAIAIGHVGTEGGKVTAEAISEIIPEFNKKNIKLVFISELDN